MKLLNSLSSAWFYWMLAAYLLTTYGDILIKKGSPWLGAALYASSAIFWVKVLSVNDLSSVAVLSSLVGNAMVLTAAFIFLGERLSTMQWSGVALSIGAFCLIQWE